MKKILLAILLVLVLLGLGGWYMAHELVRGFHVAGEGFKVAAGEMIASGAVPSSLEDGLTAKLMPYDMRPMGACIRDEDCYFYMFAVHLGQDTDTVIYDRPDMPDENPGHWTTAKFKIGDTPVERRVRVVNALTPSQCIRDRECVWYAFYNIVARNVMGDKADGTLNRWEGEIQYYILPDETPSVYREKVEETFSRVRPFFPHKIYEDKGATLLIFFSDNFERDVFNRYRKFFSRVYSNIVFNILRQSNIPVIEMDYYAIPARHKEQYINWAVSLVGSLDSWWEHALATTIHSSLGLGSVLNNFPFSISNLISVEKENLSSPDMTSLDLFLVALLYHPAFESGMRTDEKVLRLAFDKAYDASLNDFFVKLEQQTPAGREN